MQDSEKRKNLSVLLSVELDENKIMRNLVDAGLQFNSLWVTTGNDVITRCVNALDHRSPFDLIILTNLYGSIDQMRISAEEAITAIRCIPAYINVPVIKVSSDRHLNTFKRAGIKAWIHPNARDDEFIEAIIATIKDMQPEECSGELWSFTDV